MIPIGNKAPDFVLKDNRNKDIRLSDFKDKKVVLSFHPLAWPRLCAEHMKFLESYFDIFQKNNCIALGLSVDSVPSKNAWAKSLEIHNTRLLADFWPHGEVAKLYGISRDIEGFSERANIIIDEKQTVSFTRIYSISELPDFAQVIDVIKGGGSNQP